jgi:hypothetical protein
LHQVRWSGGRSVGDRGAVPAAAAGTDQAEFAHQPLDGAPGDRMALPAYFGMHLAGAVDPVVLRMHALDHRGGCCVGDRPRRGWPGSVRVVGARGDLRAGLGEDCADRLDPVFELVLIDVGDDQREGRSSSAAKKADALLRIAFARRSSRF